MKQLIVGIDFDNTIVSYDSVFYHVALEQKLIPADISQNKEIVRNYLRALGKEDCWTTLQGYVYGACMREAVAFPGVKDFLVSAIENNIKIYIISHKTRYPYKGQQYDLHKAAFDWLDYNDFFDYIGLSREQVFFEYTLAEKIKRIGFQQCMYFIDDLPEVFQQEYFPIAVNKMLFKPHELKEHPSVFPSWNDIGSFLFEKKNANF